MTVTIHEWHPKTVSEVIELVRRKIARYTERANCSTNEEAQKLNNYAAGGLVSLLIDLEVILSEIDAKYQTSNLVKKNIEEGVAELLNELAQYHNQSGGNENDSMGEANQGETC